MRKSLLPALIRTSRCQTTRATVTGILTAAAALIGVGCSHLTDVAPPSDIVAASTAATPQAAIGMYTGALYKTALAFGGYSGFNMTSFVSVSGLFSDEFTTGSIGLNADYDTHNITPQGEATGGPYEYLHTARIAADQAIANLSAFSSETPSSYLAEMHALKGYIYVMFSELYCSGVPFSYLVPGGNLVYGSAESKTQMLDNAVTQFDSALALAGDSVRIVNLAAVGKGRAYLDLADFDSAATAVASVPTSFVYQFSYSSTQQAYTNFLSSEITPPVQVSLFMSDREGGHGINYISAGDRRVTSYLVGTPPFATYPIPGKYPAATSPIVLANGIEARLIEAEVALHKQDVTTWTTLLNTLRSANISPAMAALSSDSTTTATDSVRVDVMMRERAMWLYGTGHRAGDMRRLVAEYHRQPSAVYPAGVQTKIYTPEAYVPTTNLPVPQAELNTNPSYQGCIDRDA